MDWARPRDVKCADTLDYLLAFTPCHGKLENMKSSIKKVTSIGLIVCILTVMVFFLVCMNVAAQSVPFENGSPAVSVVNGSPVNNGSPGGTHGNTTIQPVVATSGPRVNDASSMPIVLFGGIVSMIVVLAAVYLMMFKNK